MTKTGHRSTHICKEIYIPERILFQWHVTDRCNLHCSHCYQVHPSAADPSWDELLAILEQFKAFIVNCRDAAFSRTFPAHVTVTGGEPFLREDFLLLLEQLAAEKQFFSFAVLTNGTLLTPAMVHSLRQLHPSFIQVSIDGARETHDAIRGAGSHKQAVDGVKMLVAAGIPAYLSFTAHQGNYRDFPDVAQLGRRLGAARVWSDRMVPCASGDQAADLLMSPEETRRFIGLMESERKRGWLRKSPVVLHRSLQFTSSGTTPYRCCAGDTLITVLSNGDVCPCRRMPLTAGNIHHQPLELLYQNSEIFRCLRDRQRISSGCEGCFYARTCGGGARCIAFARHGDPFRADPGCWLATGGET
ncbi:MAG: radical SAM protein [Desulfuromonadales bacterium]